MSANILAVALLWAWPMIVLAIFAVRPPRQAVIISFIVAWLFLPGLSFNIPALPDWTKVTATVFGTMLGALIFDTARVLSVRPKWYDIPVVVWCLCPFASSVSVGAGAYDGFSAVLDHVVAWGLPYLLGRIYFCDAEGAKELVFGIAIGGLSYVPLCFFEMRFSQILRGMVYGIGRWEGTRYGGYRPAVFLSTGLELGMWMTLASISAQRLWASGAVRTFRGYPFGKVALVIVVTTFLCRSTGALGLFGLGMVALWATKLVGRSWPIWLILAIPPAYCVTRTTGAWSGDSAVQASRSLVGEDRAQSLEFRFLCENHHIVECMKKPYFGYSRTSGYVKAGGKWTERIVDGYWMIMLGTTGIVGLAALNAMLLLPMVLTTFRFPAKAWSDPEVAPTVALALFLVLFMIDNLSNAMPNPIYAVAMGSVAGMSAIRKGGSRRDAEVALEAARELTEEGRAEEAIEAYHLAVELWPEGRHPGDPDPWPFRAEALGGLSRALLQSGRAEEAERALREALAIRLDLASGGRDAGRIGELAATHEGLARLLSDSGRAGEAIAERRKALDLRDSLAAGRPRDPEYRARRVDALNDLAWLLATDADEGHRDPESAVALAEEAARLAPENPACWNTLGVARYRAGDWAGAVEALEHSVHIGPPGGTAFDQFFLSMACRRLGEVEHARAWFDHAVAWSDRHRPGHPGLASFRREAAALLVGAVGKSLSKK